MMMYKIVYKLDGGEQLGFNGPITKYRYNRRDAEACARWLRAGGHTVISINAEDRDVVSSTELSVEEASAKLQEALQNCLPIMHAREDVWQHVCMNILGELGLEFRGERTG